MIWFSAAEVHHLHGGVFRGYSMGHWVVHAVVVFFCAAVLTEFVWCWGKLGIIVMINLINRVIRSHILLPTTITFIFQYRRPSLTP